MLQSFLSGAVCLACLTIGLFFLRFWRRTGDRFFIAFAAAFWLLTLERILLGALGPVHEFTPYVYIVRLLAFALIILAILDKNRKG
jgi:hypothetical protein